LNCDRLAWVYRALEYMAFGKKLEKQRCAFLNEASGANRALLLGDGDGRFLVELARRNQTIRIDCVEASARMIQAARTRLLRANLADPARISFHQADARLGNWPDGAYDLVVTHFFLDCFCDSEVDRLVPSIRGACAPGAKWLLAEFEQPAKGWRRWHARCWLFAMYSFFRVMTGLETRRLPEYRTVLSGAGFSLTAEKFRMGQLICSELWELKPHAVQKSGDPGL
jgi:ubiquinone/menaquinone biosynthesis C-methylase UbiE